MQPAHISLSQYFICLFVYVLAKNYLFIYIIYVFIYLFIYLLIYLFIYLLFYLFFKLFFKIVVVVVVLVAQRMVTNSSGLSHGIEQTEKSTIVIHV